MNQFKDQRLRKQGADPRWDAGRDGAATRVPRGALARFHGVLDDCAKSSGAWACDSRITRPTRRPLHELR